MNSFWMIVKGQEPYIVLEFLSSWSISPTKRTEMIIAFITSFKIDPKYLALHNFSSFKEKFIFIIMKVKGYEK